METYIVRIYRREENRPHDLIGIVEAVGAGSNRAFRSVDELCTILNGPSNQNPAARLRLDTEARRRRDEHSSAANI
jgi:hypothetical protein